VELFSQQKLESQTNIAQNQLAIVNGNLSRAGHANQLQEIRLRDSDRRVQELSKAKTESDQAVSDLRKELHMKQVNLESEKKAVQALNHEFKCHAETENDRDYARAMSWKMAEILNILSSNNGDLSNALPDEISLGTVLHEWESMKHERTKMLEQLQRQENELQRQSNELQHNQQIVQNLLEELEVASGSTCLSSGEDIEIKTAVMLPPLEARQGKRRKN